MLSLKIALGASVFVCGVYYLSYAFRHSDRLKESAALLYILLGLVGIISGMGLPVAAYLANG